MNRLAILAAFIARHIGPAEKALLLTLTAILIWIVSAAMLSAPSFNALMKAGWFALGAFGFSISLLAMVGAGFQAWAGLKLWRSK